MRSFLLRLQALPITIDLASIDHTFGEVLSIARKYQRSAYDASYLEVAQAAPLAARDEG